MFEENFHQVLHIIIYAFEVIGVLIILFGTVKSFIVLVKHNLNMGDPGVKLGITQTLSMALEFLLAAEVIKTIMADDVTDLIILGSLVVLRIVISLLLMYEIKVDSAELKLEDEKDKMQKKMVVRDILVKEAEERSENCSDIDSED